MGAPTRVGALAVGSLAAGSPAAVRSLGAGSIFGSTFGEAVVADASVPGLQAARLSSERESKRVVDVSLAMGIASNLCPLSRGSEI
jgi:hypothetical protein